MLEHFESIVAVISAHARRHGERDAIIFLERGEVETERLSYWNLLARVEAFASGLIAAGLAGEPVMLALPAGTDFVCLFLGCLHAGAIAIPVPYPDTARSVDRLRAILADCNPAAIITDEPGWSRFAGIGGPVRVLTVGELEAGDATPVQAPVAPDAPAFVQYTSGSTQTPKGIVVTHRNLVANERMIQAAFRHDENVVGVNWLPHYHDMGLIGTALQGLFVGGLVVLMPPRAFIQKPVRWLKAIQEYGGMTAGGPCFSFELCTRTISPEQARDLDLSSWNVAFCGSEPIRPAVLHAFAERFRPAGFRANAFLPCYGLAETTLIASSARPGVGVVQSQLKDRVASGASRQFVSCGPPVEGSTIVIRDDRGNICRAPDAVGEICIAGPHVSPGRWNGADRSIVPFANSFTDVERTFLATGDIGTFVDGELYPIDRINDVIILYGAKIHAADVEVTVLDAPEAADIRAAAAFAIDDGKRENLALICELDRHALKSADRAALAEHLRKRVAEAHGVVPSVVFVAYGALPRTSSGKIQRAMSKINFLSEFSTLTRVEPGAGAAYSARHSNGKRHAEREE